MKIFLEQFLVLGGFYFVISYLFNFFTTDLFEILNRLLTICLVITVIVLFFKKSFRFLDSFCKNHSKTHCNYITIMVKSKCFSINFLRKYALICVLYIFNLLFIIYFIFLL